MRKLHAFSNEHGECSYLAPHHLEPTASCSRHSHTITEALRTDWSLLLVFTVSKNNMYHNNELGLISKV